VANFTDHDGRTWMGAPSTIASRLGTRVGRLNASIDAVPVAAADLTQAAERLGEQAVYAAVAQLPARMRGLVTGCGRRGGPLGRVHAAVRVYGLGGAVATVHLVAEDGGAWSAVAYDLIETERREP
jgi:hypothetical protein